MADRISPETGKTSAVRKLLMGNQAIALGAIRAGVRLAAGYPGTPSTEILETVAKHNEGDIYVEWSVNEKAALEVAAGAAYAGARVLVTMKQVGLNVASDPLMSLNYVGVKGGMVIVVADDPGPISSQTEQDTRHFGRFAKLAVFDPASPEEAYLMIADAFDFSEKYGVPVLFRPTTRICHSCSSVELLERLPQNPPEGFVKDSRWVIFPRLAYINHIKIEANLKAMSEELSCYGRNMLNGSGSKGIASGGVSYAYVKEALEGITSPCQLLKISAYPFPKQLALQFLRGLDEVLVVEELDPVIENELISLCGSEHLNVRIHGKLSGAIPNAGENNVNAVSNAVQSFLVGNESSADETALHPQAIRANGVGDFPPRPALPVRPPVLCAGCPHRASFFAVKEATKGRKAVFSGDIGCYTLGNALPLDMVDTCLCMGAGVTIAQGLHRVEPDALNFAFIGDSTFFHSGITGIINAVYNQTDIIVIILDNSTTAMTGGQPHPGTGATVSGSKGNKIDIAGIVTAIGVSSLIRVNPFDVKASEKAVLSVLDRSGVRVILFEAPCVAVSTNRKKQFIDTDKCSGCAVCVKKLGCPAISLSDGKARIDAGLCTGCGLCESVCRAGAVNGAQAEDL